MQRQAFNLEALPDELILHCCLFLTEDSLALIRFGLASKYMYALLNNNSFWKLLCMQHEIVSALAKNILGQEAFKVDGFDYRELFLLSCSKQNLQKIKDLCQSYPTILLFYPSYESQPRLNGLYFKNPEHKHTLYLSPEMAMQAIPNSKSIKRFLKVSLPMDQVDFSRLSAGIVSYEEAIPDNAIISQSVR